MIRKRRFSRWTGMGLGLVLVFSGTAVASASTASAASKPSLKGVVLNVADEYGELEGPLTLSGALKGAQYTVNWSTFATGPPIVAAEVGGSVDLGVRPTRQSSSARRPGTR
jgi:sulfonate transport system substrate-binding protein